MAVIRFSSDQNPYLLGWIVLPHGAVVASADLRMEAWRNGVPHESTMKGALDTLRFSLDEMRTYRRLTESRWSSGKRFWQRRAADASVAEVEGRLALFILTTTTRLESYEAFFVQHAIQLLGNSKITPVSRSALRSISKTLQLFERLEEHKSRLLNLGGG
jgi:hypothetical protein